MSWRHRNAFFPACRRIAWTLLFGVCAGALPAASGELYRWTDAQGNVHFGNRQPASAQSIETTQGGKVNQAGGVAPVAREPASVRPDATHASSSPASQEKAAQPVEDRAARLRRLARENKQSERGSSRPVLIGSDGRVKDTSADHTKDESWCQVTYGKSCDELENWREKAVDDCQARGSAHCDDPEWIDRYKPKTVDQQRALQEDRADSAKRRDNAVRRAQGR